MPLRAIWNRLRPLLARFSPRRRRWKRFLHSLPLDLDALPRPVAQLGPRDFIVCGVPRSGTTLLAAMLFQPPHVVTVMEPWDGMRFSPARLFASLRDEIDTTRALQRGKLDVRALQLDGTVRWRQEDEAAVPLPDLNDDYALGVKWPAYWRYVGLLPETKFLICVRDPHEVVNSFKKTGGRLARGLMYDTAFNRRMHADLQAATDDPALRRVLLYSYITERLRPHVEEPNVFVVRYERWFQDPDALMAEISAFLNVPLDQRPACLRAPSSPAHLTDEDFHYVQTRACAAEMEMLGYDLDARTPSIHAPTDAPT